MVLPFFPQKTIQRMRDLGLSESQVLDVFNTGTYETSENGTKMAVKKFSGYEIGLFYDQSGKTGQYTIIRVWKRERR